MKPLSLTRYDYAAFGSFIAYAACSVIIPLVLYRMAADLGFSLQEGGLAAGGALQTGRAVPMVASMLLCGAIAGRFGMCRSLGLGALLMGGGILFASMAPAYISLFAALMIAGLGEGIIEGLATPFVERVHKGESGRYLNFSHSFWAIGLMLAVLAGGWMLQREVSWRIVTASVAVLTIFPLAILLRPSTQRDYPEENANVSVREVLKNTVTILKAPLFWVFFAAMFVAGGGEFGLTFWAASYIQMECAGSPWLGGVGTACFAAGMFLGRSGFGILVRQEALPKMVIYTCLMGTLICLFFPFLNAPWLMRYAEQYPVLHVFSKTWLLLLLMFLSGLGSAPYWPSVQSYAGQRLMKLDRTMLFVLLSCAGVPGCAFVSWLMGLAGNYFGLRMALLIVPICYLLLAGIIFVDSRRTARASA